MSRTWLLRGGAVAVFGVLVGAWGVGFADLGDTKASSEKPPAAESPDDQPTLDDKRWVVHPEAKKPRRTRDAEVAQAVLTEDDPETAEEPAADPTDPPASPTPSTDPDPSFSPDPAPTPGPSNPPTSPPTNPPGPGEECTDLSSVLDCALDPITGQP
ncbi:MAG TPA: hypothetical protein VD789_00810 [Thermomicrobiales bacterium]|nr:hypothetical protein [Thermomicrobiales bacterium]